MLRHLEVFGVGEVSLTHGRVQEAHPQQARGGVALHMVERLRDDERLGYGRERVRGELEPAPAAALPGVVVSRLAVLVRPRASEHHEERARRRDEGGDGEDGRLAQGGAAG